MQQQNSYLRRDKKYKNSYLYSSFLFEMKKKLFFNYFSSE